MNGKVRIGMLLRFALIAGLRIYLGINDSSSSSSSSSFCDENTRDCGGDGSKVNVVTKVQKTIPVQNDGGYQNEFLFAERRLVMGPS